MPQEETAALVFGGALHAFVLDQEQWEREYIVLHEKIDRRTKEGKDEWKYFLEESKGKRIISKEDFDIIQAMRDALYNHSAVASILKTAGKEVTVVFEDEETGLSVKTRPDILPTDDSRVIFDLKKTRSATMHGFQRSCVQYGYARQAAIGLAGLTAVTGQKHDLFGFIAIEDKPPYRTEIYVLDDEFIQYGHSEFKRLLRIEKACREQNFYPNYAPTCLENLRKIGAHSMPLPGYLSAWENQNGD